MPKISDQKIKRYCVRLFSEDYEKIREISNSGSEASLNLIIRTIVHDYVIRLRDTERKALDKIAAE